MSYKPGDKIWYFAYSNWFRAVVDQVKDNQYSISILTGDGRVVPAVGVREASLRPVSCVLTPKVLYHELVQSNWPYSDDGCYRSYPSMH